MSDPGNHQQTVADMTLERVKRLEAATEGLRAGQVATNEKLDALIDLYSGFMKLYASHEKTIGRVVQDIERIKRRLDLVDA